MTRLRWGELEDRSYSSGVDRGVIYPSGVPGVPWNGLVSVSEKSDVISSEKRYYDGQPYASVHRVDSYEATVEAYTYPDELDREAETFDLSYRTGLASGHYVLHIVYGATFTFSTRDYASVADNPSAETMSWDIATVPVHIPGELPSAHLTIDSRYTSQAILNAVEGVLYGGDLGEAHLPTPAQLVELFDSLSVYKITDHGDGTWSAEGPPEAIRMLDSTTFELDWDTAIFRDPNSYTLTSY